MAKSSKGYTTDDALLNVSQALPAEAGSTTTNAIDLGPISKELGVRSEEFELELSVPALSATDLPATTSVAYLLQASDDSTFAAGVQEWDIKSINQTGGASGASAATARFKPPLDSPRYWRIKATTTGTTGGNIDDASFSLKYLC